VNECSNGGGIHFDGVASSLTFKLLARNSDIAKHQNDLVHLPLFTDGHMVASAVRPCMHGTAPPSPSITYSDYSRISETVES